MLQLTPLSDRFHLGLAVQSGFCWRANTSRMEFFRRIHAGEIGEVRSLYHTYLAVGLTLAILPPRPKRPSRSAGVSP